jgi:hypothetical protein
VRLRPDSYNYVKTKATSALVVGNPGIPTSTNRQLAAPAVADVLVVFGGNATKYSSWQPPAWVMQTRLSITTLAHLVCGARPGGQLIPPSTLPTTQAICTASKLKKGWLDGCHLERTVQRPSSMGRSARPRPDDDLLLRRRSLERRCKNRPVTVPTEIRYVPTNEFGRRAGVRDRTPGACAFSCSNNGGNRQSGPGRVIAAAVSSQLIARTARGPALRRHFASPSSARSRSTEIGEFVGRESTGPAELFPCPVSVHISGTALEAGQCSVGG